MEDERRDQTLQTLSDELWGSVLSYLRQQDQLSATTTCPDLCRCVYEVALVSKNRETQCSLASLVRLLGSSRLQSARSIDLSHQPTLVTDALLADLKKLKPSTSKGVYFKKMTLSTTMGPGLTVDHSALV